MKTIVQSIRILVVFTLLTGVIYPFAVAGVARVAFAKSADGSLIEQDGKIVGSALLAQNFTADTYFWPRPSAADFATVASGASNKGPTSADLLKSIAERRAKFGADAPVEMLTASGSGLDPHISPEAARQQASRVATARKMPVEKLMSLIAQQTEGPQWGVFGEARVNVLILNRALDQLP